ncbi:MAG: hypothetical protein HDQ87_08630 [Clostridia bacterium]|nr:hypothetical protein [Clostridia bacterium]
MQFNIKGQMYIEGVWHYELDATYRRGGHTYCIQTVGEAWDRAEAVVNGTRQLLGKCFERILDIPGVHTYN